MKLYGKEYKIVSTGQARMQVFVPLPSSYVITEDGYSIDSDSTQYEENRNFVEVILSRTALLHTVSEENTDIILSQEAKDFLASVREYTLRKMRRKHDTSSWLRKLFYKRP